MAWMDRGGACYICGVRSNVLAIWHGFPHRRQQYNPVTRKLEPTGEAVWIWRGRARCYDQMACEARHNKARDRSRTRTRMLVLAEAKFPDAPSGTCRWCGAGLTGENGARRRYCYLDREGRDCIGENNRSRVWTAADAVFRRGDSCCAECGSEDRNWEADHTVALEDGGEHTLENLQRLCVPCHKTKTKAEARARAERRRAERAA